MPSVVGDLLRSVAQKASAKFVSILLKGHHSLKYLYFIYFIQLKFSADSPFFCGLLNSVLIYNFSYYIFITGIIFFSLNTI